VTPYHPPFSPGFGRGAGAGRRDLTRDEEVGRVSSDGRRNSPSSPAPRWPARMASFRDVDARSVFRTSAFTGRYRASVLPVLKTDLA